MTRQDCDSQIPFGGILKTSDYYGSCICINEHTVVGDYTGFGLPFLENRVSEAGELVDLSRASNKSLDDLLSRRIERIGLNLVPLGVILKL